jgi:glycerol-3-phosphate dehydrogenase
MNDLASGTSSAAAELVHGGLRYLEHYKFRLVLNRWPSARCCTPRRTSFGRCDRAAASPGPARLVLRIGLLMYDTLGGRKLLPATTLDLSKDEAGKPLKEGSDRVRYSDCWVDDARLVALTA